MKDLLIRAASGALYVAILIGSLFISKYAFVLVIFILGLLTCVEYSRLRNLSWWLALPLLLMIFIVQHYLELWVHINLVFIGFAALINMYLLFWLFRGKTQISSLLGRLILIGNIVFGFAAISVIPFNGIAYSKEVMIGVLVMLWANDTFAYLVGKNFGKNKLMPSVSPNKTIEGLIGGAVGAILTACVIWYFVNFISITSWITLAFIIVIFGSIGDLIQSRVKRIAGVKDSGVIMPGHGGIYDRLDSLIFTAPFVYLYLNLVCYVS